MIARFPTWTSGAAGTLESIQKADLFGSRLEQDTEWLVARIQEISGGAAKSQQASEPDAGSGADLPPRPGWLTALDTFDRTYQEWIGWTGTMISPFAMSSVLHLGTDPGVAAVYLSRVPLRKAARMLAASPPAVAGEVLKKMKKERATAILNHIPANIAQAIVETM